MEVNVRVLERAACMQYDGDARALEVNQMLFANDTALEADLSDKTAEVGDLVWKVCERRKLRISIDISKVMKFSKGETLVGL